MALNYDAMKPLVAKAARVAHSSYPDHYDVGDTEQAIWLWVVENENTVHGIAADTWRPEAGYKPLYRLMLKAAYTHLKKEDAQTYGYHDEDVFHYSTELIEKILEVVFRHEDWQSFATALTGMPRGKSDPATAGNNLASYADVSAAVGKLSDDQYNLIVWRYKYNYTFEQLGAEYGITKGSAKGRLNTALKAIQRHLGHQDQSELRKGYSSRTERPGTAEMNALTERQYNG
jgi:DNA-directed RNA polymerase specialized sigma24 family protein